MAKQQRNEPEVRTKIHPAVAGAATFLMPFGGLLIGMAESVKGLGALVGATGLILVVIGWYCVMMIITK